MLLQMFRHFLGTGWRGEATAQPAAALGSLGQRLEEAVSCFAGAQCHLTIGGKKKLQAPSIAKLFATWAARLPPRSAPAAPHLARPPRPVDGSGGEEAEALEAEVTGARRHRCRINGLDPLGSGSETAGWILLVCIFPPASRERENEIHVQSFWSISVSKSHSCLPTTPKTPRPS